MSKVKKGRYRPPVLYHNDTKTTAHKGDLVRFDKESRKLRYYRKNKDGHLEKLTVGEKRKKSLNVKKVPKGQRVANYVVLTFSGRVPTRLYERESKEKSDRVRWFELGDFDKHRA